MKRFVTIVFAMILTMGLGAVWGVADEDTDEQLCIPFELTIEALEGVEAKRAPVEFSHTKHYSFNCRDCHHQWTGTVENLSCTTSECHDLAKTPKNTDDTEKARYYKKAYHKRCIGCHKLIKSENSKLAEVVFLADKKQLAPVGPTGCIECHPKDDE